MFIFFVFLIAIALTLIYSYMINKHLENRILLFLPTILGSLWFLYLFTLYNPEDSVGLAGIAVLFIAMIVLVIMVLNLLAGIFLVYRKDKNL